MKPEEKARRRKCLEDVFDLGSKSYDYVPQVVDRHTDVLHGGWGAVETVYVLCRNYSWRASRFGGRPGVTHAMGSTGRLLTLGCRQALARLTRRKTYG